MEVRTDEAEAAALSISEGLGPRTRLRGCLAVAEALAAELTSGSDEAAASEGTDLLGIAVGVWPLLAVEGSGSSDILTLWSCMTRMTGFCFWHLCL